MSEGETNTERAAALMKRIDTKFAELATAKAVHHELFLTANQAEQKVKNLEYEVKDLAQQMLRELFGPNADRLSIGLKWNW